MLFVPPDLRYRMSGLELAKDPSQILFQVAATVGTIAVRDNRYSDAHSITYRVFTGISVTQSLLTLTMTCGSNIWFG